MTDPILSYDAVKYGRVYLNPGFDRTELDSLKETNLKAFYAAVDILLTTGKAHPSITNVIGGINPVMEGYYTSITANHVSDFLLSGKGPIDGWKWFGENFKNGLKDEATSISDTYREWTADRGTRVHKFCEDFIEAGLHEKVYAGTIVPEDYLSLEAYKECEQNDPDIFTQNWFRKDIVKRASDLQYIQAFFNFITTYKPKFINQEATVYGTTNNGLTYAGTTDFIAEINGEVVVGDWKTTKDIHGTVALQLAAVIKADKITTDFINFEPMPEISKAIAVQLKPIMTKNPEPRAVVYGANYQEGWELFKTARDVWSFYITGGDNLLTKGI